MPFFRYFMAVQMLLDLDFLQEEDELAFTQKRIDEVENSLDKVRKRLFAEVGALKKLSAVLVHENLEMKKYLLQWGFSEKDLLDSSEDIETIESYLDDAEAEEKKEKV